MAVVEHFQTNQGDIYELHDEGERFNGLIVNRDLAVKMEEQGVAKIVSDLGETATGSSIEV